MCTAGRNHTERVAHPPSARGIKCRRVDPPIGPAHDPPTPGDGCLLALGCRIDAFRWSDLDLRELGLGALGRAGEAVRVSSALLFRFGRSGLKRRRRRAAWRRHWYVQRVWRTHAPRRPAAALRKSVEPQSVPTRPVMRRWCRRSRTLHVQSAPHIISVPLVRSTSCTCQPAPTRPPAHPPEEEPKRYPQPEDVISGRRHDYDQHEQERSERRQVPAPRQRPPERAARVRLVLSGQVLDELAELAEGLCLCPFRAVCARGFDVGTMAALRSRCGNAAARERLAVGVIAASAVLAGRCRLEPGRDVRRAARRSARCPRYAGLRPAGVRLGLKHGADGGFGHAGSRCRAGPGSKRSRSAGGPRRRDDSGSVKVYPRCGYRP